jgi:uncharacterized membrane protein
MSLCKYRNFFGKPGKGVHSYRIPLLDVAAVDVIATLIVGYLIALYSKWNYWLVVLVLFLLGIAMHRLFCVRTKIDQVITKMFWT